MTTSIPEMSIGYQQVVEALGDAVVICDRDGIIRVWNVAAERLFGFTRTDALSIAFTVGLLFGPEGKVTGIAAVIRDDSDHFAKDRELRRLFADEGELRKALNESLEEAQRLGAYEEEKRIHGYY